MDRSAFFWQIQDGKLPPPRAAATLGISIREVSPEAGTIEVEFEGKPEFTNPAGHIQGGFLAAMLDDTMGPALAATLGAGEFAPTLNLKRLVRATRRGRQASGQGAHRETRQGHLLPRRRAVSGRRAGRLRDRHRDGPSGGRSIRIYDATP
jgi:acyl-coenzyme A thioesterase PaaI-like protein